MQRINENDAAFSQIFVVFGGVIELLTFTNLDGMSRTGKNEEFNLKIINYCN